MFCVKIFRSQPNYTFWRFWHRSVAAVRVVGALDWAWWCVVGPALLDPEHDGNKTLRIDRNYSTIDTASCLQHRFCERFKRREPQTTWQANARSANHDTARRRTQPEDSLPYSQKPDTRRYHATTLVFILNCAVKLLLQQVPNLTSVLTFRINVYIQGYKDGGQEDPPELCGDVPNSTASHSIRLKS